MEKNEMTCTVLDPKGQPSGVFGRRLEPDFRPGAILDPFGQPTNDLESMENLSMPSSTTSFGRMVVVNGPIRNEIDINCEASALSPFNFANAVSLSVVDR